MLIKITNYCSMGCSHCMEDSTIKGQHMTFDMFKKALDLSYRLEHFTWKQGFPAMILLSGGECTEHPQIVEFIEEVERRGWFNILISNGLWLNNEPLRNQILKPGRMVQVQVGHDPRFYPQQPPKYRDERVQYKPLIEMLMPLGRATHGNAAKVEIPLKQAPGSFNLRSITRSLNSVERAIHALRMRSAIGKSGMCTPNITEDGVLHAGETRYCYPIGNVDSPISEITQALIHMQCNKCGLVNNLTPQQKAAINETV